METGTLLIAAAMTNGEVTVRDCRPDHLEAALAVLDDAGVAIDTGHDWIRAAVPWRPLSFHLTALPYPGVPTDVQPQFTALAAIADGHSTIADYVFPERFAHVDELNRLGANIQKRRSTASVEGVDRLDLNQIVSKGNPPDHLVVTDLRCGAALVLTALSANGCTSIGEAQHLRRGYERFAEKLRSLGAEIESNSTMCYNSDRIPSYRLPSQRPSHEFQDGIEYFGNRRIGTLGFGANSPALVSREG